MRIHRVTPVESTLERMISLMGIGLSLFLLLDLYQTFVILF